MINAQQDEGAVHGSSARQLCTWCNCTAWTHRLHLRRGVCRVTGRCGEDYSQQMGSKMLSQIGRWDRLGRGVWEGGPEIYCKTQAGGAVHHQVKQLCWGRAADDSIAYFSMV
jgi:hypothetical protein